MINLLTSLKTCIAVIILICMLSMAACSDTTSTVKSAQTQTPSVSTTTVKTQTVKPTPSIPPAPAPTNILTASFTSSDGYYQMSYPGKWVKRPWNQDPVVNGMILGSPDGHYLMMVAPINKILTNSQLQEFFSVATQSVGAVDFQLASENPQSGPMGAYQWSSYDADVADSSGDQDHAVEFFLTHNGKTFIIIVISPTVEFSFAGPAYFQPMIESLKFLK
jgi:hypothetical protein